MNSENLELIEVKSDLSNDDKLKLIIKRAEIVLEKIRIRKFLKTNAQKFNI